MTTLRIIEQGDKRAIAQAMDKNRQQAKAKQPAGNRLKQLRPLLGQPKLRRGGDRAASLSRVKPTATTTVRAHTFQAAAVASSDAVVPQTMNPADAASLEISSRWSWLGQWYVWGSLAVVGCSGAAVVAASSLLGVPALPNCPAIFWPLAPASLRFECARLAASKRTAKDLLEAIKLVDSLPESHALRQEADRLIEQWSTQVLNQTEEIFHEGKIKEAIAAARQIPPQTSAYELVEERVKEWETIWAKAEAIQKKAEEELRQRQYRRAFEQAVRLLNVENKYWQTTRYDTLIKTIDLARIDGNKLYEAERLADEGGSERLLKALKIAQGISAKSFVYEAAQKKVIPEIGRKMLTHAQTLINQRDVQGALNLLSQVPNVGQLKAEAQDLSILANAQYQAWQGNVADLEGAIAEAQQIRSNRPLAKQAQQWIARWRQEIETIGRLQQAKNIAQSGNTQDLAAAITQASMISHTSPRREEVERQIQDWRNQLQTIEDRPILNQADQYAVAGDPVALQAAITQAQQVRQGRALYGEAQEKIRQWRWQIQAIQNQPYLEQARQYASMGDLPTAIQWAAQIPRGEAYYQEAQADLKNWRQAIQQQAILAQSQTNLAEANQVARLGTVDALTAAIAKADQVAPSSPLRGEADDAIDRWSWQLLQLAVDRAEANDIRTAIAIAQKIPSGAAATTQAQQQIKEWQQLISPPAAPAAPF